MIFSTSEVAVSRWRASSSSRVSWSSVSRKFAGDAWPIGAFRALGLFLRRTFAGCPLFSRRLIIAPEAQTRDGSNLHRYPGRGRLGSNRCLLWADMCSALGYVRFGPIAARQFYWI